MESSISDVFEDCLENLSDLPSELQDNMAELAAMDKEFQEHREKYKKQRRSYLKLLQKDNKHALRSSSSPTTPLPMDSTSLDFIEKEFEQAVIIQDEKIDTARRCYDRLSRRIEQLDSLMQQNNVSIAPTFSYDMNQSTSSHPMPSRSSTRHSTMDESRKHEGNRSHRSTSSRKRARYVERQESLMDVDIVLDQEISPNEPRYCYCNQVSFGEMVACDGRTCEKEWFHYSCVGLTEPPTGQWFCIDCMEI